MQVITPHQGTHDTRVSPFFRYTSSWKRTLVWVNLIRYRVPLRALSKWESIYNEHDHVWKSWWWCSYRKRGECVLFVLCTFKIHQFTFTHHVTFSSLLAYIRSNIIITNEVANETSESFSTQQWFRGDIKTQIWIVNQRKYLFWK